MRSEFAKNIDNQLRNMTDPSELRLLCSSLLGRIESLEELRERHFTMGRLKGMADIVDLLMRYKSGEDNEILSKIKILIGDSKDES